MQGSNFARSSVSLADVGPKTSYSPDSHRRRRLTLAFCAIARIKISTEFSINSRCDEAIVGDGEELESSEAPPKAD